MNLAVQSLWITVLAGNVFSLTALQTHSACYTTSGSTSSISTAIKPSIMRKIHKPIDTSTHITTSASSSSSTSATTATLREQISSLLSNSLDMTVWSVDVTTEKIKIYHLTQKGVSCNSWFFETKYLEPLDEPSPSKSQPTPCYLAALPPTTKYPSGRVVASCTGGVIKIFDLKNRTCTHVLRPGNLYLQASTAKLTVSNQNIFLGYGPFFEMYKEQKTDTWLSDPLLTLSDAPNCPTPTIDALAVLPNGCVVMLLATKLQIDNHMLVAMDLATIIKGTIAKHTEHHKILKNYGTTTDGLPFILLPNNNKILLTLTETKIFTLAQQKDIWSERELLMVSAPTAKLLELLVLINSSMKGKDCIAVKKFTQHDTVFYKCYYDSKELPSILLPDQQMAVIWKGKIMTFGLNEKALS